MRTGHTPTFRSYLEEGTERPGPLGMVTQPGAFGTHLLALAKRRGILSGVWISTGNEADSQVADGVSFLADDPETEAIACYVEAIKDRDRFVEAVTRARANGKPVIAMRVAARRTVPPRRHRIPPRSPAATRSVARYFVSSVSSARSAPKT